MNEQWHQLKGNWPQHTCGVAAAGSNAKGSPAGASLAGASELQTQRNQRSFEEKIYCAF